MGFLSGIVLIEKSDGTRADAQRSDGTYAPVALKLSSHFDASYVHNGSLTEVTLSAVDVPTFGNFTAKATPVVADELLINDSADGNKTKVVTIGDLPVGSASTPVQLPEFLKASLPSAATFTYCWILVSDETGGAVPAFSDGTNWRRCQDRAIVS